METNALWKTLQHVEIKTVADVAERGARTEDLFAVVAGFAFDLNRRRASKKTGTA